MKNYTIVSDGLEPMKKYCSGLIYKNSIISENSEYNFNHNYKIALYLLNKYEKINNMHLDAILKTDFAKLIELSIKNTPLIKRKYIINNYCKILNI